jgi:predicted transposase YdaD
MTTHNASAIDAITAEPSEDAEFEEMIRHTAYYKKGFKEGLEEARAEAKQKRIEKGISEGRVMSAVAIIQNRVFSIEAIAEILHLTAEEITAVQAMLQQSSNGNGSNDTHL